MVGVVIPAYGVQEWLDACLASLVSQSYPHWRAIVVDDGSVDATGEIADAWADRESRIAVIHTQNAGLGAARNAGVAAVAGDYLAFLDSDDVLPPTAYADLVATLEKSGSDFATGSIARWQGDTLIEPAWMHRLHRPLRGARVEDRPEILGDVFAWNKLWRRSFWDDTALTWPTGVRYEDQPTTTRAFLAGSFDVLPEIVYHWRIRSGSITQTRSSMQDLQDRWDTKRMSLASVRAHGSQHVEQIFVDRVLAGDLWRYFLLVPGCEDAWWELLRDGVCEFWGDRSLVNSGLPPVHRLAGWLIEQDRRDEVVALMEWLDSQDGERIARSRSATTGEWQLSVPNAVIDSSTLAAEALAVRPHEV